MRGIVIKVKFMSQLPILWMRRDISRGLFHSEDESLVHGALHMAALPCVYSSEDPFSERLATLPTYARDRRAVLKPDTDL